MTTAEAAVVFEGDEEDDVDDEEEKKEALTWKMSPYCEKRALR